jgi:hypothetical protein
MSSSFIQPSSVYHCRSCSIINCLHTSSSLRNRSQYPQAFPALQTVSRDWTSEPETSGPVLSFAVSYIARITIKCYSSRKDVHWCYRCHEMRFSHFVLLYTSNSGVHFVLWFYRSVLYLFDRQSVQILYTGFDIFSC